MAYEREELSEKLRAVLERRNWTTQHLADFVGAPLQTAYLWVRPANPTWPSARYMDRIDELVRAEGMVVPEAPRRWNQRS